MTKKPVIVITTGDPQGIGEEITKKALRDPKVRSIADFIVITPEDGIGLDAVRKAVAILKQKKADALVTAPLNKTKVNKAGIPFTGHTEYIAALTKTRKYAMMFYSKELKVTLVTRHVPLKQVPSSIKKDDLKEAILLTNSVLKERFKIRKPRIGVSGLNPHCGEGGVIGDEERTVISPVIKSLRKKIPLIAGPIPGDIIFNMAYRKKLDAVISMYHDQALAPFKMLAFERGVNVTLGLPFVRTSPDHGTAYDIAGKGMADPGSMKEAIRLASFLSK
ncbi:MAG: 4-hydroxythreonine-4-phosphate dehydrogenase PdxA [Candidatus Omnitrophota bacterium]